MQNTFLLVGVLKTETKPPVNNLHYTLYSFPVDYALCGAMASCSSDKKLLEESTFRFLAKAEHHTFCSLCNKVVGTHRLFQWAEKFLNAEFLTRKKGPCSVREHFLQVHSPLQRKYTVDLGQRPGDSNDFKLHRAFAIAKLFNNQNMGVCFGTTDPCSYKTSLNLKGILIRLLRRHTLFVSKILTINFTKEVSFSDDCMLTVVLSVPVKYAGIDELPCELLVLLIQLTERMIQSLKSWATIAFFPFNSTICYVLFPKHNSIVKNFLICWLINNRLDTFSQNNFKTEYLKLR